MSLKKIFENCRIIGLAGNKHSGKTNNIIHQLKKSTKNKKIPVYFYGIPKSLSDHLKKLGYKEISSLKHLVNKKNCLVFIDEFQKLKLNDRRNKDTLNKIIDFVYHNNIYLILSTPNIREFNTVIGGVIEGWLLKSISLDQCVNGSQLKRIVENYKGNYKQINDVVTPVDEMIYINDSEEVIIKSDYDSFADTKKGNKTIF